MYQQWNSDSTPLASDAGAGFVLELQGGLQTFQLEYTQTGKENTAQGNECACYTDSKTSQNDMGSISM